MLIWPYRLLFLPALIVVLPYYLYRMFKRGGYIKGFWNRLGIISDVPSKELNKKRIWIHAVSVGELLALHQLLKALAEDEKYELALTTTTSTGLAIAKEKYKDYTCYAGVFPIDFYFFSRSYWKNIDPDLMILMESELWPEHLNNAKKFKKPIILANARLSDRSFQRYRKFKFIKSLFITPLSLILASSKEDAERYIKIGAKPDKVKVTGNLKFDNALATSLDETNKTALLKEIGIRVDPGNPLILLGSSTWPGEEAFLISLFEEILKKGINCKLIIVPRHAERRNDIIPLLKNASFSHHVRSQGTAPSNGVDALLADTTGELKSLTRLADIAFIGKSISSTKGGQTPIEAASQGIPIVYGPHMTNFSPICKSLEHAKAAFKVNHSIDAKRQIIKLLEDESLRKNTGDAAKRWHATNVGATARTIANVKELLSS